MSGDGDSVDTNDEPAERRGRRHWLWFSLCVCLVVLTLGCVWFGWQLHLAREQKTSVDAARKVGGSSGLVLVLYDYELDVKGNPIRDAIAQPPGPDWLRRLVGLDFFCTVRRVHVSGRPLTDANVLVGLKGLTYLQLAYTQVSDVTPLAKLNRLEHLDLSDTPVRDLGPLAELTRLVHLDLSRTPVNDVTPLTNLDQLEVLDLFGTQVADPSPLGKLGNLRELYLNDTPVSAGQIEALKQRLPNCSIHWEARRTPR